MRDKEILGLEDLEKPEEIEILEEKNVGGKKYIVIQASKSVSFSGPIPHPDILKGYNEIVPGAAERILIMAEEQQKHRFSIENKIVSSSIKMRSRGSVLAFVILLLVIMSGIYLIIIGKPISGFVTLITALVPVLTTFLKTNLLNIKNEEDVEE